jgi:hypothetical protein
VEILLRRLLADDSGTAVIHGKRPAFQFYPKDWLSNPKLRLCSVAARGVWADLLCIMHSGEPYGHLALGGFAIPNEAAARMIGLPLPLYRRHLSEIEKNGVSSRTSDGVLYSRRMVKDERIRQLRAEVGSTGGKVTRDRFAQAKPVANEQQGVQQMVAAADEDAVGSTQGGAGGSRSDAVRNLLPEDCREAFDGLLRASPNPAAFVGEIRMAPERIRGATWEHVGAALRDLALAGNARPSGLAFRSFVQKAIEEAAGRPTRKLGTGLDFEAAAREAERAR